ncbi:MAG: LacI family DNA-binding transcriptional regulator, partial [Lachnospiraceae bacterium]|nr:LacI family DNA-binding transcriptional regulator [Lachnospiraceae bacterium]
MVTIKDVAQDAGVAVGTVSKVINGQHVSEKNRKKVEDSIRKLGYQINYYAKGFKMQKTFTAAVIVPDVRNPFFSEWVYYLEQAFFRHGYKIFLCNTQEDGEKEEYYFKMAVQNKVDGIVCISYQEKETPVSEMVPVISLDRHFEQRISCICSDNYHGGELAAMKMIEGGSRELVYIRSGSMISGETLKRGIGFADYCKKKKIHCRELFLGEEKESIQKRRKLYEKEIRDFVKQHTRKGKPDFDGIYTSTDWLGGIVLSVLSSQGISIPDQVQLVGHDGLLDQASGEYILSTIVQPVKELAEKSVELLLEKMKGTEIEPITMLPVTFG